MWTVFVSLKVRIGAMEQRGTGAVQTFTDLLFNDLVFRRASSKVVGKSGLAGFF